MSSFIFPRWCSFFRIGTTKPNVRDPSAVKECHGEEEENDDNKSNPGKETRDDDKEEENNRHINGIPSMGTQDPDHYDNFSLGTSNDKEDEGDNHKEDDVTTAKNATASGGKGNPCDGEGDSRVATLTSIGNRRRLVSKKEPHEHPYGTDDEEEDDDEDKEEERPSSNVFIEAMVIGGRPIYIRRTSSPKQTKKTGRRDRKRAAVARNNLLGARPCKTNVINRKQGIMDCTEMGDGHPMMIEDAAFRQAVDNGARSIDRQAAKLLTGITISSSKKNTCMPDALETIISSIMKTNEELENIPLPDGRFVALSDLGSFLRRTLCPNQHDFPSAAQMKDLLEQIGFTVEQQLGESKIKVLTQEEGNYIICCKFPDLPGSPQHCISYLADSDCRLLIDNFPYQKPVQILDAATSALKNDVKRLSRRLNHDLQRKIANEIFKMVLGRHTNEIRLWYKISWTKKERNVPN